MVTSKNALHVQGDRAAFIVRAFKGGATTIEDACIGILKSKNTEL